MSRRINGLMSLTGIGLSVALLCLGCMPEGGGSDDSGGGSWGAGEPCDRPGARSCEWYTPVNILIPLLSPLSAEYMPHECRGGYWHRLSSCQGNTHCSAGACVPNTHDDDDE